MDATMRKYIAFLLIVLLCLSLLSLPAMAATSLPTEGNAQRISPLWFGVGAGALAAVAAGVWFFVKRKDNT